MLKLSAEKNFGNNGVLTLGVLLEFGEACRREKILEIMEAKCV